MSAIFAGIEVIKAATSVVGASWPAQGPVLSAENAKTCALGTIREVVVTMASRLSALRRIEAKRLITHLFAHEQFDADRFAELLAGVIIDTPEVVTVAARDLEDWNNFGRDRADSPRFVIQGNADASYESIAEVVLNAAAVYRGETTEDPNDCHPLNDYHTRSRLSQAAAHLRAVADGKTDRRRSETHASRLEEILKSLGNVEDTTDDREV